MQTNKFNSRFQSCSNLLCFQSSIELIEVNISFLFLFSFEKKPIVVHPIATAISCDGGATILPLIESLRLPHSANKCLDSLGKLARTSGLFLLPSSWLFVVTEHSKRDLHSVLFARSLWVSIDEIERERSWRRWWWENGLMKEMKERFITWLVVHCFLLVLLLLSFFFFLHVSSSLDSLAFFMCLTSPLGCPFSEDNQ